MYSEKKVLHFGVLAEEGVDRLREKEYALTKSADDNTWTVLRAEKRKLRKVHLEEILKEVGGKAVVIGKGVSCAEAPFLVVKRRVVAMYQETFLVSTRGGAGKAEIIWNFQSLYNPGDEASVDFFSKGNFIATNKEDD
eukprot:GHVS01024113.1.p1 GENE.GHVS01024113.1~~GHVS01024113.1.p1  ORF type:complete len:138 (-),score=12.47 GHVS01024113.1:78-491(-)